MSISKLETRNLKLAFHLVTLSPCLLVFPACSPESPPPPTVASPAPAPQPELTPLDTVRLLHERRTEGQTSALGEFLMPEQADAVIDHLYAVDELTSANESLKSRLDARVGPGSALALDRTAVTNMVGPFSRDVEVLSETVYGDRAKVSIRVGSRLPLEEVNLKQSDGRWRVVTDPPIPGLADELRKLARATLQVVNDLDRRTLSGEQVEKELALRQGPILKRIDALVQSTP